MEYRFFGTGLKTPLSLCAVGVSRSDTSGIEHNIIVHQRKTSEFMYVIAGKGTNICNKKEYNLKAGDTFYIPRDCNFESYPDPKDPWITVWINSFGDLVPELIKMYNLEGKFYFPNAASYTCFKRILKVCRNEKFSFEEKEMRISVLIHELVQILYAFHDDKPSLLAPFQHKDAHAIKVYIDNNIQRNIKMSEIGRLIYKSEAQAIRLFKQTYGLTPCEYLMKIRMSLAKQLLADKSLSVKEIAYKVGYADEHYFSHLFKLKTGKTPTDYRNGIL